MGDDVARYGKRSRARLSGCHPLLIALFSRVVFIADNSIITGHRGQGEQNSHFAAGRSKVRFPFGKHNPIPSEAVDAAPWPIVWPDMVNRPQEFTKDFARFAHFAGIVKGVAAEMDIKIRWGGDWDGDGDLNDQSFDDLMHFELVID